jgi:hypothetical protein
LKFARSIPLYLVMAAFVAAIHFPETEQEEIRLWKMDRRDEPGDDGFTFESEYKPIWMAPFCGP